MANSFHANWIKNDKITCVSDSKKVLFVKFGCKTANFSSLWSTTKAFARATAKGYFNGVSTEGDPFQNGGCFLLNAGEIVYSHIDQYIGDLPDFTKILSLLPM